MRGVVVNRDGAAEVTPGDAALDGVAGSSFDALVARVRTAGD
jgi:hypothetical protein